MAFDLYVTFRHLPSGITMSGFVNEAPLVETDDGDPVDRKLAGAMLDELQEVFVQGQLKTITLFTRDHGQQISIPFAALKDCVLVSVIQEVQP